VIQVRTKNITRSVLIGMGLDSKVQSDYRGFASSWGEVQRGQWNLRSWYLV